jgi:2-polyprenyl-3-methyl-5-hydroxy-6-metoxy-1,4-benzoquinol methylase
MLDETSRLAKARKIIAVTGHFLGRDALSGLVVADVGCSGGIIADSLAATGARVVGLDIDVPGVRKAAQRYLAAGGPAFVCADSQRAPLAAGSVDVVVCNHIYEHVVSPEALVAEIGRVLSPDGIAYLGLGNRWGVVEPHYRLPFLSYLPRRWAHSYVRAFGRATHYHEAFRSYGELKRLFGHFDVWDYTYSVLAQPERFAMRSLPAPGVVAGAARILRPIVPTFIWVATKQRTRPRGPSLARAPRQIVHGAG